MNRQEFVARLEAALRGEVPPSEVQSNVQYYNDYILTEVSKGRPEEEVLEELGDPRLIARTIFDSLEAAAGGFGRESYTYEEPERGGSGETRRTVYSGSGFSGPYPASGGPAGILRRLLPALILVGIVVAVVSVISLVFSAAWILLTSPVFWCAAAAWLVWNLFRGR